MEGTRADYARETLHRLIGSCTSVHVQRKRPDVGCGGAGMGGQRTCASMAWSAKGKVTRRERFLAEMGAVIPWRRLLGLIDPHYPKAGNGRQPLGLEKMLRIYFLQQWFNLSDPQAEDAIYDSESMRLFARVELGDEVVPDESTILRFRHLLEQHGLTHAIFDAVADLLEERAAAAALGHHRGRDHH